VEEKRFLDLVMEACDKISLAGNKSYAVLCSKKVFNLLAKETGIIFVKTVTVTNFAIYGLIVEVCEFMEDDSFLVVNKECYKSIKIQEKIYNEGETT